MLLSLRTHLPLRGIVALLLLATGLASTALAQLLYVPAYGKSWITEYTTDAGTPAGALNSVACITGAPGGAPSNSVAAANQPVAVAMTPNGNFLYASNRSGTSVIAYSVNNTQACLGELTQLASYSLAAPYGATVDPSGTYLFVSQGTQQLTSYKINGNGTLTPINTVSTGSGPEGVATAMVGPNLYVYVALSGLSSSNVAEYSAVNGVLSSSPVSTGTVPGGIWDSNAVGYVSGTPATYLSSPQNLVVVGGSLYVTDDNADGTTNNGLSVFAVGATLGSPTNYKTGSAPQGLASDGTYLYVANQFDPSVWSYPLSNLATHTSVTAGLAQPWGVTADPLTNSVYVSDIGTNSVFGFTQNLVAGITGSPWNTGAAQRARPVHAGAPCPCPGGHQRTRGILYQPGPDGDPVGRPCRYDVSQVHPPLFRSVTFFLRAGPPHRGGPAFLLCGSVSISEPVARALY